ncbi:hypothetical protein [Fluviicola taffensis]|uniref:Uncharacterized protein n=1 Tax=Fluviicola taffensis (strain DSM 16823 / NCIMB 13979 / RW262) TaxID=755732 RepID=F2IHX0_FLUTR|nr:hypothetical protein [Fluviicola taffensis]AEA45929.1 hypothetical protein Fluta_3965 [Fluviicola taffensis DSM 16823]
MNKDQIHIEILGLQHFCIKDKNPIEKIKQKYSISNLSEVQILNKIDWNFLYEQDDDSKNFILLTDLNDWSYFIWKYWDFEFNINFAKELSEILKSTVNYYFVDSNIATSRWIFANEGEITRSYFESHGQKLSDFGFNETEVKLRETIKETFVEDIFWDLYEKTCLSLEYVNNQKVKELKLYSGTLGNIKKTANSY